MAIADQFLNFLSGGFAEKGVDLISKFVKDKDLAERLSHDFRVLCQSQDHELQMTLIGVEQDFEREQTKRIQAEQQSNDSYTKRTRPKIARLSFYFGSAYILANVVTTSIPALNVVPLDWTILGAMYSPALTYMGVREFGKWKNGPKA